MVGEKLGPSMVTTMIQGFSDSWVTSYRFQDEVELPCIFGCEGCHDTLKHYLRCDILWTTSCTALGLDIGWLNLAFPQRFGHPIPYIIHINLNAVMFKVYHTLRKEFSHMSSLCIAGKDFSDIQSRSLFLANHFASEIID